MAGIWPASEWRQDAIYGYLDDNLDGKLTWSTCISAHTVFLDLDGWRGAGCPRENNETSAIVILFYPAPFQ
jgi:hypothetical protein